MSTTHLSGIFAVHSSVTWARRWYESIGWCSVRADNVFVPFPLAGGAFALWSLGDAARTVAAVVEITGSCDGVFLSTVVDAESEVDDVLAIAEAAGGRVAVPADETPYGRVGWFTDLVGTPWEVSWIRGRTSAAPFAGSAAPTALISRFDAVTLTVEQPERVRSFYADMGWVTQAPWAGRPAMGTAGPALSFAQQSSAGPRPPFAGVAAADDHRVRAEHDALVGAGATSLVAPHVDEHERCVAAVTDPHGLVWEIVHDPRHARN